jgi:ankyrin repeat protein
MHPLLVGLVDPRAPSRPQGYTPLHHAVDGNQLAVVERLVDKGVDIESKTEVNRRCAQGTDTPTIPSSADCASAHAA